MKITKILFHSRLPNSALGIKYQEEKKKNMKKDEK